MPTIVSGSIKKIEVWSCINLAHITVNDIYLGQRKNDVALLIKHIIVSYLSDTPRQSDVVGSSALMLTLP